MCTKCNILKPVEDFGISRKQVCGRNTWCKQCHADYRKTDEGRIKARKKNRLYREKMAKTEKHEPVPVRTNTFTGNSRNIKDVEAWNKANPIKINRDTLIESYGNYADNLPDY